MASKISKSDLETVGKKLGELRTTLPTEQQRALDAVIAGARGGDVQGFIAGETTVELEPTLDTYQQMLDEYNNSVVGGQEHSA